MRSNVEAHIANGIVPTSLIFVSYSRSDGALARFLAGGLAQVYRNNVFLDTSGIPAGSKWIELINNNLRGALLLVCLVGQDWARKIGEPGDFVRQELECALGLGLSVLPILVDNTEMPPASALPESLTSIASFQAEYVQSRRPHRDLPHILKAVNELLHSHCSYVPDVTPREWDHERLKRLSKLSEPIQSSNLDFQTFHALIQRAQKDPAAQFELGLRYLVGVGPHAHEPLGLEHLIEALVTGDEPVWKEFRRLSDVDAISQDQSSHVVTQLAARKPAALEWVISPPVLTQIAIEGNDEAAKLLADLADKGDRMAQIGMSRFHYERSFRSLEPVVDPPTPTTPKQQPPQAELPRATTEESEQTNEAGGGRVILILMALSLVAGFLLGRCS